jgi:hypothetical protein
MDSAEATNKTAGSTFSSFHHAKCPNHEVSKVGILGPIFVNVFFVSKLNSYILCMLNLKLIRLSYEVLQQRRLYSCVGKVHTSYYIKRTAIQ